MRWLVLVVVALLALAPAARADVTIGSGLGATTVENVLCNPGCSIAQVTIPGRQTIAPARGVVTRWRIQAGTNNPPVKLQIVRRPPAAPDQGFLVGESAEVTPPAGQTTLYETQIPIEAGDQLALCCFGTDGAYAVTGVGTTDVWQPPLGTTPQARFATEARELLVNADIEPDIDGDGNGDDTQDDDDDGDGVADGSDDCPTRAGTGADGCPVVAPPPATPRVNTPPVVRFRTPLSGTAVRAGHAIELDVSDDAGNPTVTVFDDDGTICTLTAPPYSCTWTPTGADVGRATLLASAVDSDNRSTLGIVRVTVARFTADLTRRVRGRRVSGRLVLPAAVERALGCRGWVTVRRGRTTRTVALKRNCTYSARVGRRGRVRARFGGNPTVEPAT